jgi:hypothetical protein
MQMMINEWEMQLRQKLKYGDTPTTTWEDVREMYYAIRNEYIQIDLLDEDYALAISGSDDT